MVVWASVAALADPSGPAIIELAGWRWIFAANAPIGLAIVVLGRRLLVENRGERAEVTIDLVAVPLGTLAIGLVTLGMVQGSQWGWTDGKTLACFAISVPLAAVVVHRSAHHPEPLLDLSLIRHRAFDVASGVLLVFTMSVPGFWFAAPLYVQSVGGRRAA